MKIFVSHSVGFDYVNDLYKPLKDSALNGEHHFFFPHEQKESVNTQEIIRGSDLVIAEVSFPSTGQGIELGWANLLNVPVVCVARKDSKPSDSLRYITGDFITYADSSDFIDQLSIFLKEKAQ